LKLIKTCFRAAEVKNETEDVEGREFLAQGGAGTLKEVGGGK